MHWHLYFTLLNCTAVSLSDTMLHKWAMPHGFCNRHMNTVEYVLCFMACCTSDCNSANFNPLQPLQRDFSIPIIWVYVMAQQACLRMVSCDSVFVVVTLSLSLLPGWDSLWVPTFGSRSCRTSTVPTCAQLPLCSCHYLRQWSCATRHWIVVRLALVCPGILPTIQPVLSFQIDLLDLGWCVWQITVCGYRGLSVTYYWI